MNELAELFSRDPLGYSKRDLGEIVKTLRARRPKPNRAVPETRGRKPRAAKAELIDSLDIEIKV